MPKKNNTVQKLHPEYEGYVEKFQNCQIEGWVCSGIGIDKPVLVSIVLDGETVFESHARLYREDLRVAGKAKGFCGFCFRFLKPFTVEEKVRLEVYFDNKKIDINQYTNDYTNFLDDEHGCNGGAEVPKGKDTTLIFYPDYSSTNHYQNLLYSMVPANIDVRPADIDSALALQQASPKHKTIFHLHWVSPIIDADSLSLARQKKQEFIGKIKRLISLGGRLVWTIHNALEHSPKHPDLEKEFRQDLALLASNVHLHSKTALDLIEDSYSVPHSKQNIIPIGNYIDVFENNVSRKIAREKLGYSEEKIVFLFQGQIRPYKQVDSCMLVFSKLKKKYPNIELLVVGKAVWPIKDGDFEKQAQLLPGVTVIEEHVPDHEMQLYHNAADFCVLPFKNITTSASLLSGLSFGLPVIAPDISIIPETITDEEEGFLYNPDELEGFEKSIEKALMLDSHKRAEMSAKAFEKAKKYNWSEISQSFFESIRTANEEPKLEVIETENEKVSCKILDRPKNVKGDAKVAVVVLSYDSQDDVQNLLKSLDASDYSNFHLYIVDNASPSIESLDILATLFPDATIIQAESNIGYAAGNNIGMKYALKSGGYDYIWVLNPDIIVKKDTLSGFVKAAQDNQDIDILGGAVLFNHDRNKVWFAGATIDFSLGLRTEHKYAGANVSELPKEPIDTDYINGACLFFKPSILKEAGFIPEQYFLYFEEADWCQNAKQIGLKLKVFPQIQLYHAKNSEQGHVAAPYYLYYYIRNAINFTRKYKPELLNSTIANLKNGFIKGWLAKIEQRDPSYLSVAKSIIEKAMQDGMDNLVGQQAIDAFSQQDNDSSSIKDYAGFIEELKDGTIIGWAFDYATPNKSLKLSLYVDGRFVGHFAADQERCDLDELGVSNVNHGFRHRMPSDFYDGKGHTIEIGFEDSPLAVAGGGIEWQGDQLEPEYQAYIDGIRNFSFKGWAWNKNNVSDKPKVTILCEGEVVAETTAKIYRQDLKENDIGDGQAGFEVTMPTRLLDGKPRQFEIIVGGKNSFRVKKVVKAVSDFSRPPEGCSINMYMKWAFLNVQMPAFGGNSHKKIESFFDQNRSFLRDLYKNSPQEKLFSVIMPAYNRASVIEQSIRSVCDQLYQNWELIIVDDGSTDNTVEVIENFLDKIKDNRISFYALTENKGVSYARNFALSKAKGEFISYLDSDNTWFPETLIIAANTLIENPKQQTCYSAQIVSQHYKCGNRIMKDKLLIRGGPFNRALLENRNYIDLNVFFHHRSFYEEFGGFNEEMNRLVDAELIYRYTAVRKPVFVPTILCDYAMGLVDNQISHVNPFEHNHKKLHETLERVWHGDYALPNNYTTKSASDVDEIESGDNACASIPIIVSVDSSLQALKRCLTSLQANTDGNDIFVFVPENHAEKYAIQKFLRECPNFKVFDKDTPEDVLADIVSRDFVLMRSSCVCGVNWLQALNDTASSVNNWGIVIPRYIHDYTSVPKGVRRHYARGACDLDVSLLMLSEDIVDVNPVPDLNIVSLSKFNFYCALISKDSCPVSMFYSLIQGDAAEDVLSTFSQDIRQCLGKQILYTAQSFVYDQTYFS